MTSSEPPKKRQIKLHVPQELSAVYSNLAILSNTRHEFIVDFAQVFPQDTQAKVQSRVILSPQHAMLLRNLLQRQIERYEAQHGAISEVKMPTSLADELFRGIQSEPETDDGDDE